MDKVAVSMAARRVPVRAKKQPALTKALQSCREKLQMFNYGPDEATRGSGIPLQAF